MRSKLLTTLCALCLLLAGGCALSPRPLKPGTARTTRTTTVAGANRLSSAKSGNGETKSDVKGAPTVSTSETTELTQPENPAQSSSQNMEKTSRTTLPIPANSKLVEIATTTDDHGKPIEVKKEIQLAAPTVQTTETSEKQGVVLGAAQKDTARDLSAKLAAMRPVQWVGVLCLLGAGALAYFGWWTKAGIAAAVGVGMIVVAAVVPGNELAILSVGGVVLALGVLVTLYAYNKGQLDRYLPDALDKFPATPATPAASTTENK